MKSLGVLALVAVVVLLVASFLGSSRADSSGGGDSGGSGGGGGTGSTSGFDDLLEAIRQFEGAGVRDRNNNPGNLKSKSLAPGTVTPIGTDSRGFAVFSDVGDGWDALSNYVSYKLSLHPDWDFYDFFHYYLTGDSNSPDVTAQGDANRYAEYVAGYMGVDPTTAISSVTAAGG